MDGSRRIVIYHDETGTFHPFGLTYFNKRLYWTDYDRAAVLSLDVDASDEYEEEKEIAKEIFSTDLVEPQDIVTLHKTKQPTGELVIMMYM